MSIYNDIVALTKLFDAKPIFKPATPGDIEVRKAQHDKEFAAIRDRYLQDYSHCPYCGSDHIVTADEGYGDNQLWHTIDCRQCEHSWNEIYTLTDIEESE